MAKRGPKPKTQFATGASPAPAMPDYLKANPEAEEVWFEEIERVVAAGVTDTASSSFAAYCALEPFAITLQHSRHV